MSQPAATTDFELHKYAGEAGRFDYELYKRIQEQGNKDKKDWVWVREANIKFLSKYIAAALNRPVFGLCHGTRRGKEQEWFRKYLGCNVLGTEISETAEGNPHTIQWDFHQVKPEWLGAVDFIYSNSFDHTYDPEECINTWMSCIRGNGMCFIEHTNRHEHATELDPFGAAISNMPRLIRQWGKGKFCVRTILNAPKKPAGASYAKYLVIQNLSRKS